ncbi:MAG: hypothetical protein IKW20_00105 [Bacteroidales bacterium]|nr:hypothetical protein [Bacteroidales bacterium]
MKKIIPYIIALAVGVLIGFLCRPAHTPEMIVDVKTDTLIVRDTHIIEKPILVERTVKDSLLVQVHDTTRINDTIFVALPMERKTYKGEEYLAEISGYKPNLDRMEVYPKTIYVKSAQTIRHKNRLSMGMEASYSTIPYIPIYLEYGRMLHQNLEVYGKIFYDMPRQNAGAGFGVRASVGW